MLSRFWSLIGQLLGRPRLHLEDGDDDFEPRHRPPSAPRRVDAPGEGETGSSPSPAPDSPGAGGQAADVPLPGGHPTPEAALSADEDELEGALRDHLHRCLAWLRSGDLPARGGEDFLLAVEALSHPTKALVPQLPQAAREAIAVSQDPDTETKDLVALIHQDPALAQLLLRLANSALYASPQPITHLTAAVTWVGRLGVSNAVLQHVISGQLCSPGRTFKGMPEALWGHLQQTAPLARQLAPAFGAHPDQVFTLALLHDVGKLVLFDHMADLRRRLKREVRLTPEGIRLLLGATHEALGGIACLSWQLGAPMARSVVNHHRRVAPPRRDPVGETLYVADQVEILRQRGEDVDLDALWALGQLQASVPRVSARLSATLDQAA